MKSSLATIVFCFSLVSSFAFAPQAYALDPVANTGPDEPQAPGYVYEPYEEQYQPALSNQGGNSSSRSQRNRGTMVRRSSSSSENVSYSNNSFPATGTVESVAYAQESDHYSLVQDDTTHVITQTPRPVTVVAMHDDADHWYADTLDASRSSSSLSASAFDSGFSVPVIILLGILACAVFIVLINRKTLELRGKIA